MAINWQNTPVLDSVQLPGSETKYWVKDAEARDKIESLVNATKYIGVTTTSLMDGSRTNPILINGENVTAQTGDIVIYKGLTTPEEFIFDGTEWQLLGGPVLDNLGNLAYKNSASGLYQPQGYITISDGERFLIDVSIIPSYSQNYDSVSINSTLASYSANFIDVLTSVSPECRISTASFVALSTLLEDDENPVVPTDMNITSGACASVISSGSLPSITSSVISAEISGSTLVFGLTSLGFNAGAFPEYSFNNVVTDVSYEERDLRNVTISYVAGLENSVNRESVMTGIASLNTSGTFYYRTRGFGGDALDFVGSSSTITVS